MNYYLYKLFFWCKLSLCDNGLNDYLFKYYRLLLGEIDRNDLFYILGEMDRKDLFFISKF